MKKFIKNVFPPKETLKQSPLEKKKPVVKEKETETGEDDEKSKQFV